MKNKKRWVHFQHHEFDLKKQTFAEDTPTTICGKTALRIQSTLEKNEVTCPKCIHEMGKKFWHCPNCGFIPDTSVTFEENCEDCGSEV